MQETHMLYIHSVIVQALPKPTLAQSYGYYTPGKLPPPREG